MRTAACAVALCRSAGARVEKGLCSINIPLLWSFGGLLSALCGWAGFESFLFFFLGTIGGSIRRDLGVDTMDSA
jgi:hypothetical protein